MIQKTFLKKHSARIIFLLLSVFYPFVGFAEDKAYTLLVPMGDLTHANGFGEYVNTFITFIMGLGTGMAVLMIVVGGVQVVSLSATGNPTGISAGKEKIWNAVFGLVLLALSALILKTINPELLNISLTAK